MFDKLRAYFNKVNSAPSWSRLNAKQKVDVARKIMNMAGPRYKVVTGFDTYNREQSQVETFGEDTYLNAYRRGRLLDLSRNAVRNSSTFNSILKQLDLNVIGTKGGKAIFNFSDDQKALAVREEFAKWTRQSDFFDGFNLNTLLRIILKTYLIGGDCIVLFDDGLIEDSGKVLLYEPDEIGSTSEDAILKHYGKNAHQSLGRVYNPNGRFIGAVVSRSQRGAGMFDPQKCYFLKRDPDGSELDSLWIMPRNIFRAAQGRGVSPTACSIATVLDLEDLCQYELQAAKKNSQTLAQVTQETASSDTQMPSAFDTTTDFSGMTDEEVEEAIKAEANSTDQTMTLDKVTAAGAIYQVLPEGYRMELLDTKHPNNNMIEFVRWLAGRSAAPYGLTDQYATLNANGSDFRAQQLMAAPMFSDCQKFLEQILDWTIWHWAKWALKKEIISQDMLEDNWLRRVTWSWPRLDELDEQAYQNATALKLKNMTGSYREYYGADWKEKLSQIKHEIDWCKENNLAHPSYEMISGGERTGADEVVVEE